MKKERFSLDLSLEEREKRLLEISDEEIDLSDIPELDEEFFKSAKLVERKPRTKAISIRIDTDLLQWFKEHAKNKRYQTLINDVLRTYVEQNKGR